MNLNRRPFRLAAFTLSLLSLPVLRLAALDCNGNGVPDECDLSPSVLDFTLTGRYPTGRTMGFPGEIVVADFDGNRQDDVAVTNGDGSRDVPVFLSKMRGI